jgi:allophanate hydrolase
MTTGLKILSAGLHTTVQDLGRLGFQHVGVPVSGALDGFGLRLANVLVGNPQGAASLEILGSGPSFEIAADTARLALVAMGANVEIRGERARTVGAGQSVTVQRGEAVRIGLGRQSACGYLAVEGGIAVPSILGSASTYVRAGLGGLHGRALQRGDFVPIALEAAAERAELRTPAPPAASAEDPIRVVLGPQQDCFTPEAVALLLEAEFRVSKDADRMGMRLDGPRLRHNGGWDIVSDAIATGSIQVPGSGQPIILLADHQTTGGYPKIATVISADLPALATRRPGDRLRFAAVNRDEAEELCRQAERDFARLIAAVEPAPPERHLDVRSLYGANLISGVTAGFE